MKSYNVKCGAQKKHSKNLVTGLVLAGLFLTGAQLPALAGASLVPYTQKALVPYRGFHPKSSKPLALPSAGFTTQSTALLGVGGSSLALLALEDHGFLEWSPRWVSTKVNYAPQRNWQQVKTPLQQELEADRNSVKPIGPLAVTATTAATSNQPAWYGVGLTQKPVPATLPEGLYALGFFKTSTVLPLTKEALAPSMVQFRVGSSVFWEQLEQSLTGLAFHTSGQSMGNKTLGLQVYGGHFNDALPNPELPLSNKRWPKSLSNGGGGNGALNLTGGWYNGDSYRKELATNAVVAARLLGLYQQNPSRFNRVKATPAFAASSEEARLPVLLRQLNVGLNWLRAMQLPEGAFLSSVHSQKEPPLYTSASADKSLRFYEPPELEASLLAIASLARASEATRNASVASSVNWLRLAEKGWLAVQPNLTRFSELSLTQQHALFWALTELAGATEKEGYVQWLQALLGQWQQSGFLQQQFAGSVVLQEGLWSVLHQWPEPLKQTLFASSGTPFTQETLRNVWLKQAAEWKLFQNQHPWSLPVGSQEGSLTSEALANRAIVLLRAASLLQAELKQTEPSQAETQEDTKASFKEGAWQTYAYLLGVNPWNQAFVTEDLQSAPPLAALPVEPKQAAEPPSTPGLFTKPAKVSLPVTVVKTVAAPCHTISLAATRAVPGLLVTGPGTTALQASRWVLPVKEGEDRCEQNTATVQGTATLALLAGLLNEAYNPPGEAATLKGTTKEPKAYKLPTITQRRTGGR